MIRRIINHCGKRVQYASYAHLSGICMREPHGDEVAHIVEMVTPDVYKTDYQSSYTPPQQFSERRKPVDTSNYVDYGAAYPKDETTERGRMVRQLRPHQQDAVDRLSNGKILLGGTGVGKTMTSLAYFYQKVIKGDIASGNVENPMNIYVITTARKRDSLDWEGDAATFGIGKYEGATIPGVQLHVDSWNNIKKYEDVENAFFIFDEQRVVGYATWVKAFLKISRKNQWILLTATPGDTWMDYLPVFIANGFYKNKTEFTRRHVQYSYRSKFPKIERYWGESHLRKLRDSVLVDMPFERHTTRVLKTIKVDHDVDLFKRVVKDRWHVYEERPLKDVSELFIVMRKVVNSDDSRLEAVQSLLQKHPRLIVFYNFDYELDQLRRIRANGVISPEPTVNYKYQGPLAHTPKNHTCESTDLTSTTSLSEMSVSELLSTKNGASEGSLKSNSGTSNESLEDEECRSASISHTRKLENKSSKSSDTISPKNNGTDLCSTIANTQEGECLKSSVSESVSPNLPTRTRSTLLAAEERIGASDEPSSRLSTGEASTKSGMTTTLATSRPSTETTAVISEESDECLRSSENYGAVGATVPLVNGKRSEEQWEKSTSNNSSSSIDKIENSKNITSLPSTTETFAIAEWNGHNHQSIPDTDSWLYLVQYQAGAEAWNCISTDAMVFYSLNYSYKIFEQAQGRIDRMNTPFSVLNYYVLLSDSMIDKAIMKALKNKESFNELKYRINTRAAA